MGERRSEELLAPPKGSRSAPRSDLPIGKQKKKISHPFRSAFLFYINNPHSLNI